jgi:hypothetical protein
MKKIACMAFSVFLCLAAFGQGGMEQFTAPQQMESDSLAPSVVAVGNCIKVTNAPVGSYLEVYSVVGIKVAEIEMKTPNGEYVLHISKGYYIVRIGNVVRKIALR